MTAMPTDWSRAVRIAAEVLAAEPELEDEQAAARLEEHGVGERAARVALAMLPIAFGRVLLAERGVTSHSGVFHVQDANGKWVPFEFAAQPAFLEATQLAVTARHRNTIDRHAFEQIGARSVELERAEPAPVALLDVTPEMFEVARPWWKVW